MSRVRLFCAGSVCLLTYLISCLLTDILSVPAYNDRVLAFLRQPNITDVLKERGRATSLSSQLKSKIIQIRSDGMPALERLANDVDLITLLRYNTEHFGLFIKLHPVMLSFTKMLL